MTRIAFLGLVIIIAGILTMTCSTESTSDYIQPNTPLPAPTAEPTPVATPMPKPTPTPTPVKELSNMKLLIDQAISDFTQRVPVPASSIGIISVSQVNWPDTSLGCPNPDQMYAQVITPGYKIILKFGALAYPYHGKLNNPPFLCEDKVVSLV